MRIITTGASNTTTFCVCFAMFYNGKIWSIAKPFATINKGYMNERNVYCYIPYTKAYAIVTLDGSANPNSGITTPAEFCNNPFLAEITYKGDLRIYQKTFKEFNELLKKGVREYANIVPGRFCPEPPCKEHWDTRLYYKNEDIIYLLENSNALYYKGIEGTIPLEGWCQPYKNKGRYVSSKLPVSLLETLQYKFVTAGTNIEYKGIRIDGYIEIMAENDKYFLIMQNPWHSYNIIIDDIKIEAKGTILIKFA